MVKRSESRHTRSPISRVAHAHIARSDFNLVSSSGAILAMMICGAAALSLMRASGTGIRSSPTLDAKWYDLSRSKSVLKQEKRLASLLHYCCCR
jgi:hypothetical protein